jgi:hypothetical protein
MCQKIGNISIKDPISSKSFAQKGIKFEEERKKIVSSENPIRCMSGIYVSMLFDIVNLPGK